jgi:pimeloyl-ACP methyl ester carboxylesterase
MTHSNTNFAIDTSPTVRSADGTAISYLTVGAGPGVLVIPGALSTADDYAAFARALATRFTVHTIERRGRGRSGPQGDDYGMEKERQDVLAVLQETGARFLVGHSYGGLVALEAARDNPALAGVAVYEPGVSIGGSIAMDWMPDYEMRLAEGKHFDAFVAFTRGTGPARARSAPPWLMKTMLRLFLRPDERRRMLALLPENLREHREVARLDGSYGNYRAVATRVLLMYGGKSGIAWVDTAMERLAAVLPDSETREFPALDHLGIDKKAPGEVARAVGDYFLGVSQ